MVWKVKKAWPMISGRMLLPSEVQEQVDHIGTRCVVEHLHPQHISYSLHTRKKVPGTFSLKGKPRPGVCVHNIGPVHTSKHVNLAVVDTNGDHTSVRLSYADRDYILTQPERAVQEASEHFRPRVTQGLWLIIRAWILQGAPDTMEYTQNIGG